MKKRLRRLLLGEAVLGMDPVHWLNPNPPDDHCT
jgi:hypothetical protein